MSRDTFVDAGRHAL